MDKPKLKSGFLDLVDGKKPPTPAPAAHPVPPLPFTFPSHFDGRCAVAANGVYIAAVLNNQFDDRTRSTSHSGRMKGRLASDTWLTGSRAINKQYSGQLRVVIRPMDLPRDMRCPCHPVFTPELPDRMPWLPSSDGRSAIVSIESLGFESERIKR